MNGFDSNSKASSRIWQANNESIFFPADEGVDLDNVPDQAGSQPAVFNQAVFQVPSDSLAPGQARVYTVSAPIVRSMSDATSRTTVPMAPISSTDLDDFNNCVQLTTQAAHNLPKSCDVREQTVTSLIQLEMSTGGQTLRRLSGFELNNVFLASL